MKKLGLLFVVSVLLLSVVACGKSEDKEGANTNENTKEKLTLATSPDYPPYEFIDTSSGEEKIIGFDIDLANLIAAELGFEIEIKSMDFNGLLAALQSGQADFVMAGMTPNKERRKSVDFSKVYYGKHEGSNTILTFKSSNLKTVEDLKGKKVAAQLGTAQEAAAKEMEGIELISLNKIPEMVQELMSGRIDAVIIEEAAAKEYVKNYPELGYTPFSSEGLNGVAVAFPKGSKWVEKFNQAIDTLTANGKIAELADKWMKDEEKK